VKDVVIIGGPNGAGKTTAAQVLLPQELDIREFVNADEIARGLSCANASRRRLCASAGTRIHDLGRGTLRQLACS
jgi:predicted ABC-type ATPase